MSSFLYVFFYVEAPDRSSGIRVDCDDVCLPPLGSQVRSVNPMLYPTDWNPVPLE